MRVLSSIPDIFRLIVDMHVLYFTVNKICVYVCIVECQPEFLFEGKFSWRFSHSFYLKSSNQCRPETCGHPEQAKNMAPLQADNL